MKRLGIAIVAGGLASFAHAADLPTAKPAEAGSEAIVLQQPMELYQVLGSGLPADLRPLHALWHARRRLRL